MADNTVINMDEHFDVDATMDELVQKRFAMPPAVVATFRQAAALGAMRLLNLVNDEDAFNKLRAADKVRVLELIFDRAYGKSETASNHDLTQVKVGGGDKRSAHSDALDKIATRAARRRALPSTDGIEDAEAADANPVEASLDAAGIGSMSAFPELRERVQSAKVVTLRRPL